MKFKRTLLVAATLVASMLFLPAKAATFVLQASTHDRFNGEPIRYDAVLRTGAATITPQGTVHTILGASGTASYDIFTVAIEDAFGSFTLDNGVVTAIGANFQLGDPLRGGAIKTGARDFVAVGEVGGPIETLTITQQSAVPEPASWALLLLGFGGMGAVLRRRVDARRIRYA